MADASKPAADDAADNLLALIKQLIKEKLHDGVTLLFTSNKEAERNLKYLSKIGMDIYEDICLKSLTDEIYTDDLPLYNCAEELLKFVASHGPKEELLLELLDLVEGCKSENVFTSALKGMQVILLSHGEEKPRTLEWCLNSIYQRLKNLPVPSYLKEGCDEMQQGLLEEDEQVQHIFIHYITVGFFYAPLLNNIITKEHRDTELFYPVGTNRRNVLCCFLIQNLGKPLSLLHLSTEAKGLTNTYSLQCAISFTKGVTKCVYDPLFLLSIVEPRVRFKRPKTDKKEVYEINSCNIFLNDEKVPLECLAIYYYMIFVNKVDAKQIPAVYHPLYILETCLYLIYELLQQEEPPLFEKALALLQTLLEKLKHYTMLIPTSSLEIAIYKDICFALCNIIGYSPHTQLRQMGIKALRLYILSFEDEAKYLILKNLLKTSTHHGITGYLITLYKDLVAEALTNSAELNPFFCSSNFSSIFLNHICSLPKGVETDILEMSDQIISSLNAVRYFALKDNENRTGFWNFAKTINDSFLTTLRNGLNLSVAHFKTEQRNLELGIERPEFEQLKLLDINVQNDNEKQVNMQLDRNSKIKILNQNLCTFDLIRSLLCRTCECLENNEKLYMNKTVLKTDVKNQ